MQSYFITDRTRLFQGDELRSVLGRVAAAGVEMVQIREKDLRAGELEELVTEAIRLTANWGVKILVNDRFDVALSCGAAGCHLPGTGLPVKEVRRVSPPGFLIGVSTHHLEEALVAEVDGADFLVFGPVFPTISKPGVSPAGVEALADVAKNVRIPVFALGGITPERVAEVSGAGVAGVAGISVFMGEDSLRRLMNALKAQIRV
jgi:thiamine-phosphate pyrophosphorylase